MNFELFSWACVIFGLGFQLGSSLTYRRDRKVTNRWIDRAFEHSNEADYYHDMLCKLGHGHIRWIPPTKESP